jgi:hypothetical protein
MCSARYFTFRTATGSAAASIDCLNPSARGDDDKSREIQK